MTEDTPSQETRPQKSLEEQFQDERTLRRFTEQVLDCRQMELEIAEAENKRLLKKLDHLSRETLEIKAQLRTKDKNLRDAGDQIFRLQPHRQDITESEARETYKSLCNKVHWWVDNRLAATLDAVSAGQLKKAPAQQAAKFLSLLREPGRRCLAVHHGDEYHVVAGIMHYLWLALFSKPFYCPLDDSGDDSTLSWIAGIEKAMAKTRDEERCREWRSETLKALSSQKPFKSRRDSYLYLICKDLSSYLTVIFPKMSTLELQSSLGKGIVQPAADLAHSLHTSTNIFWLKWPLKTASSRLEVYECTNLADGGRTIDLSGTSPDSSTRRHTKYLFDIAPGLFVERVEDGKKMALKSICRPKVLVHAGEGPIPHNSTLLTWLYNATSC